MSSGKRYHVHAHPLVHDFGNVKIGLYYAEDYPPHVYFNNADETVEIVYDFDLNILAPKNVREFEYFTTPQLKRAKAWVIKYRVILELISELAKAKEKIPPSMIRILKEFH